jgi:hypothetical protein
MTARSFLARITEHASVEIPTLAVAQVPPNAGEEAHRVTALCSAAVGSRDA